MEGYFNTKEIVREGGGVWDKFVLLGSGYAVSTFLIEAALLDRISQFKRLAYNCLNLVTSIVQVAAAGFNIVFNSFIQFVRYFLIFKTVAQLEYLSYATFNLWICEEKKGGGFWC